MLPRLVQALVLLLVSAPALASDGLLELNQTCAVQTGCVPGDTPGFPIVLSGADGHGYRLTSNLVVPDGSNEGIRIVDGGITIDLNRFSIVRSGCEAIPSGTICPFAAGSMAGIQVFNAALGVSVRNGSIIGMGGCGLSLGPDAEIRNVRVISNSTGICADDGSIVVDNLASRNEFDGIRVAGGGQGGALVSGNTIRNNGRDGISLSILGNSSIVSHNTISQNGGRCVNATFSEDLSIVDNVANGGTQNCIECGDRCLVRGNNVSQAAANGITVGTNSIVAGNLISGSVGRGIEASTSAVVTGNGVNGNGGDGVFTGNASTIRDNTSNLNDGDGIEAGDGSNVNGNTGRSNGGFGLRAESTLVGFAGNVFGNNNGGAANPQTSSGRDLGGNQCDSVATCP